MFGFLPGTATYCVHSKAGVRIHTHTHTHTHAHKGGGSRGATGALAPPIAKVGGLSPPKSEVNAPPTYFELRHCHVEMAGCRDDAFVH